MTDINKNNKTAVILSGGGADGADGVGVLKALFNETPEEAPKNRPLNPDIFCGTSVGAYNATFLVSQWDQYGTAAITNLEKVWLDELADSLQRGGNGVYRIRTGLFAPLLFWNF